MVAVPQASYGDTEGDPLSGNRTRSTSGDQGKESQTTHTHKLCKEEVPHPLVQQDFLILYTFNGLLIQEEMDSRD